MTDSATLFRHQAGHIEMKPLVIAHPGDVGGGATGGNDGVTAEPNLNAQLGGPWLVRRYEFDTNAAGGTVAARSGKRVGFEDTRLEAYVEEPEVGSDAFHTPEAAEREPTVDGSETSEENPAVGEGG